MMKDEYWLAGACVLFPCFLLTPRRATLSTFFKQTLNSLLKKNACTIAFLPHSTTLRLLAWILPYANTPPPPACIQTANVHFGNSSDGPFPSDNFFITEFLSALSYILSLRRNSLLWCVQPARRGRLWSLSVSFIYTPLRCLRSAAQPRGLTGGLPGGPQYQKPSRRTSSILGESVQYIRCIMLWTVWAHGTDIGSNFSSSSFFVIFLYLDGLKFSALLFSWAKIVIFQVAQINSIPILVS